MSTRFEAEAIIRAAASGDFPAPGEVLLRVQDGWVFGKLNVGDLDGEIDPDQIDSLPFTKITGQAAKGQLPSTIAYEDEANVFLFINTFQDQVRRGIRTISVLDSPYSWQTSDWHLNVDTTFGRVIVDLPDAADHFDSGFTDQLHIKKVAARNAVELRPSVVGQEVDGFDGALLRKSMRSFTLVSDGVGWWIQ